MKLIRRVCVYLLLSSTPHPPCRHAARETGYQSHYELWSPAPSSSWCAPTGDGAEWRGPLSLSLSLSHVFILSPPQTVLRCDPHIGLLHRGTEKLIEYKTYMQVRMLHCHGLTVNRVSLSLSLSSSPFPFSHCRHSHISTGWSMCP